jgi:hypothetical protein
MRFRVLLVCICACTSFARAAESKKPWEAMDYGGMMTATLESRAVERQITPKGMAITLGEREQAHVIFDQDLLRYSVGWTRDFIDWKNIQMDGSHRTWAKVKGDEVWGNGMGPRWGFKGSFEDPRTRFKCTDYDPLPGHWVERGFGPLPKEWGQYRGCYRNGRRVILSYDVGSVTVLDSPDWEEIGGAGIFTRTLNVAASTQELEVQVLEVRGAKGKLDWGVVRIGDLSVGVVASDARWDLSNAEAVRLKVGGPAKVKILIGRCSAEAMAKAVKESSPAEDLSQLCRGGKVRFEQKITVGGGAAQEAGAFDVQEIPVPKNNPWNARMRFGGFDFFKDGKRAAICTWDGDVWIVSGIEEAMKEVTWQRIAAGLFQPLGLKIVANAEGEEEIYVCCRDQIVRLKDLNGDGEADFYECSNGDHQVTEHFHEFAMGLQTDGEGNFYYAKAARHALDGIVPQHGTVIKVSKDGKKSEIVCDGFRAPNGIGIGPAGEMIATDQEGFWMPANRINLIKPGGFYGNLWSHSGERRKASEGYDPPICWLPNNVDRSPAEDLWVTSEKWGPLAGKILHTSYGMGTISLLTHEEVNGVPQGGVVQLVPKKFATGIMRARFNPVDGQLYVCGLVGWSSNTAEPGGFYRIRYTGRPLRVPVEMHVQREGVELVFAQKLDRATAEDVGRYGVARWNYRWTENYGSKRWLVSNPGKEGEEEVKVVGAKLSEDGKKILLKLDDMRPVMQMRIDLDVKGEDGGTIKTTIHGTVNRLP